MSIDLEKFKGSLTPEDFAELEEKISSTIDELSESKAEEKAKILVEEKAKEIDAIAEEYCERTIKEKTEEIKTQLEEEYKQKFDRLETLTVERLDAFLETEINENISDKLLESIAVNETLQPLVEGIKSLFEEKYVSLDTKGAGLLKKAVAEIETLQTQVSEGIKGKMDLVSENQDLKAKLLISEKIVGLTEKESARVKAFFEGKSYEEITERIGSVIEMVTESDSTDDDSEDLHETKDANAEGDLVTEHKTPVKEQEPSIYEKFGRFV